MRIALDANPSRCCAPFTPVPADSSQAHEGPGLMGLPKRTAALGDTAPWAATRPWTLYTAWTQRRQEDSKIWAVVRVAPEGQSFGHDWLSY